MATQDTVRRMVGLVGRDPDRTGEAKGGGVCAFWDHATGTEVANATVGLGESQTGVCPDGAPYRVWGWSGPVGDRVWLFGEPRSFVLSVGGC